MRKALAFSTAAAALATAVAIATPAAAEACTLQQTASGTCTTVSLTVVDGALTVLVTAAAVGTSSAVTETDGVSADISLGTTTVTDTRLSSSGWAATVTSSPFTTTVAGADPIPASASSFYVTPTGTVPGLATLAYSDGSASDAANNPVASGGTLVTATSTGPSGVVVYAPMLRVAVPAGQLGGLYTGTVTQSVS